MKRQLAWTFVAEGLVMAATVLALRLAAQALGPYGFGEYTLSRRVIGLLQLPLALGLGIAAPRYVAIAEARGEAGTAAHVAVAAVALALSAAMVAAVAGSLAPGPVAAVLLGSSSLAPLVRPVLLALVGFMAHSLLYALLRGQLRMSAANALQTFNAGVVPVVVLLLAPHRAATIVGLIGAIWLLIAGAGLAWTLLRLAPLQSLDISRLIGRARELLAFGLPRIPGEFALVALFALPPVLVAHTVGVIEAGHLSFALSVLTMVGSAFAPIGLILLPRASAQAATGRMSRLRRDLRRLLTGALTVAVVGVGTIELLAPYIVVTYLGAEYAAVATVLRWALLGAVPYVAYIMLRNVLDAVSTRPINSANLIAALAVVGGLSLVRHDAVGLAMNLAAGLTLLGLLTWWRARRLVGATPVSDPTVASAHLSASAPDL